MSMRRNSSAISALPQPAGLARSAPRPWPWGARPPPGPRRQRLCDRWPRTNGPQRYWLLLDPLRRRELDLAGLLAEEAVAIMRALVTLHQAIDVLALEDLLVEQGVGEAFQQR